MVFALNHEYIPVNGNASYALTLHALRNTCDRHWRSSTSRSTPFRTPTSKWTHTASISLSPSPIRPAPLEVYPHAVQYGTRRERRRALRRHNLNPICAHGPEGWMKRQALISVSQESKTTLCHLTYSDMRKNAKKKKLQRYIIFFCL
jgi:hypothetical protein